MTVVSAILVLNFMCTSILGSLPVDALSTGFLAQGRVQRDVATVWPRRGPANTSQLNTVRAARTAECFDHRCREAMRGAPATTLRNSQVRRRSVETCVQSVAGTQSREAGQGWEGSA